MKASDVFRASDALPGEKVSFAKMFPEVAKLRIEVTESDAEFGGMRRVPATTGEYIDCTNPLCYNGGFRVGEVVREMIRERKTSKAGSNICQGYEGSPKGKKKYRDCLRWFQWKIEIEYNT
jgi:hypothetical protein